MRRWRGGEGGFVYMYFNSTSLFFYVSMEEEAMSDEGEVSD